MLVVSLPCDWMSLSIKSKHRCKSTSFFFTVFFCPVQCETRQDKSVSFCVCVSLIYQKYVKVWLFLVQWSFDKSQGWENVSTDQPVSRSLRCSTMELWSQVSVWCQVTDPSDRQAHTMWSFQTLKHLCVLNCCFVIILKELNQSISSSLKIQLGFIKSF